MLADARVLTPEFVPTDVVHRDDEINLLASVLRPITTGDTPDPAYLHGPSGTGKTCIATYTLEKLREATIDVATQYVNCWEDHSRFDTLYRALEGVGRTLDIHRQSTPKSVLLDRLHDYNGPPYVIILDEVDQIDDPGVLYELYNTPSISLVLIGNDAERFLSRIDERVASRMRTATRIQFHPYSETELVSILSDRVRWGLDPASVADHQLSQIADAAGGDARIAIGILRAAAREASQEGAEALTDAHITDAIPAARTEISQKTLDMLTPDQHAIYTIITDHGEIAPGELYTEYRKRVSDPKTKRMVRNYLQKLRHYNLVTANGDDRGRTYAPRLS